MQPHSPGVPGSLADMVVAGGWAWVWLPGFPEMQKGILIHSNKVLDNSAQILA